MFVLPLAELESTPLLDCIANGYTFCYSPLCCALFLKSWFKQQLAEIFPSNFSMSPFP